MLDASFHVITPHLSQGTEAVIFVGDEPWSVYQYQATDAVLVGAPIALCTSA